MYKLKAKTNYSGEGWGIVWVNGEATTEDKLLAEKLQDRGYLVEEVGAKNTDETQETTDESGDDTADAGADEDEQPKQTYPCPECGKEFKTVQGLQKHIDEKHP